MSGWLVLVAILLCIYISQIIGDNYTKKHTSTTNNMSSSSSSIGTPPLPLLALFAIVLFYLYLSTYFPYKEELHRAFFQLKIFLYILPALLLFMMRYNSSDDGSSVSRWYILRLPKPDHGSVYRAGGSPWGVAALVVLVLVMLSYHSSVGSHWFRPLWYDHYFF